MAREGLAKGAGLCPAWLDEGLRAALLKDGCRILEQLLEDPSLPIPGKEPLPGEKHHPGRRREMQTVLGPVRLKRSYFYRPASGEEEMGQGRFPLDEALGLVDAYSPGLAKMMCRAGAMSSGYEAASADLKAYAGLEVEGRQIHRMVNQLGPDIQAHARQAAPARPLKAVEVFYAAVDGTGVPMLPEELEGREGKQEDGSAKTREVKLGCVFTQEGCDEEGRPMRDPDSTTYVASFSPAKDFGPLIRAEAVRRGMGLASKVVLLGDGAAWIWEIARTCFPFAVQIVDFFHACEHLTALTGVLFGAKTELAKEFQERWRAYLEFDQVGSLIIEARGRLNQPGLNVKEALKAIGYFQNNRKRMLYGEFREKGYFIGSGVVEAGCKSVIGQRAKQSGMLWSVQGAEYVLAIRCAILNQDFAGFWERRASLVPELKKAA